MAHFSNQAEEQKCYTIMNEHPHFQVIKNSISNVCRFISLKLHCQAITIISRIADWLPTSGKFDTVGNLQASVQFVPPRQILHRCCPQTLHFNSSGFRSLCQILVMDEWISFHNVEWDFQCSSKHNEVVNCVPGDRKCIIMWIPRYQETWHIIIKHTWIPWIHKVGSHQVHQVQQDSKQYITLKNDPIPRSLQAQWHWMLHKIALVLTGKYCNEISIKLNHS